MADKVKFDKLQTFQDACSKDPKKVHILVALSSWSLFPGDLPVEIENAKKNGKSVTAVDPWGEGNNLWELGIKGTPCVMCYFAGKPVTIRRAGFDDDSKLVGNIIAARFKEVLDACKEIESGGEPLISLEF